SPWLVGAYTTDPELLAVTIPVVAFLLFVLPMDGGQVVVAHALRGRGETWVPAVLHVIAYLFIMMPLGWILAIRLERGVIGLFEAIFIASVVSVILLGIRFWRLSIRDRRRILSS
ncbi:MAG: MATE family efflux transporter, partial [Proteobacteria bacterium]|nr:MATE family efflux transporter [Pseudomonadota bacterium]